MATTVHNWLAIATLALHLIVVARLVCLEQDRSSIGPEDASLIIVAETLLALLLIDGLYLSWSIEATTRVMHHLAAFAPAVTSLFFVVLVRHSTVLSKGRQLVRCTLALFAVNSTLIFLAYWVSIGAAMGWWLYPEQWANEIRQ